MQFNRVNGYERLQSIIVVSGCVNLLVAHVLDSLCLMCATAYMYSSAWWEEEHFVWSV